MLRGGVVLIGYVGLNRGGWVVRRGCVERGCCVDKVCRVERVCRGKNMDRV